MQIKKWLFREKMTVKKLSELLKVNRTTVQSWIKGSRGTKKLRPSVKNMEKIRELTNGEVKEYRDIIDNRSESEEKS